MPRNVTITFGDGSSHVYNNVPDNVTPEQATARATQDFPGKQVTHLDGGRGGGGQPQQAQRPAGIQPGSAGDPFAALERSANAEQQGGLATTVRGLQEQVRGGASGVQGMVQTAARSFARGYREGTPGDTVPVDAQGRALTPAEAKQRDLSTDDPDTRWGWQKALGIAQPRTAAEKQQAEAQAQAQTKEDKERGGFWLSSLPEFAGTMAAGGPGAAAKIGGAVRGVGRLVEPVTNALTESQLGRRLGIGAGERANAPFQLQQGSLAEARAADATRAGRRTAADITTAERGSAALPGGGAAREAVTAARTRSAQLDTEQIANNLSRGVERTISTERAGYGRLSNADRERVAVFWRSNGPDGLYQALLRSGQQRELLPLVQQATSVLTPGSARYVASEMIARMSRDASGAFSVDTFMRNWQSMAPAARDAVFGDRVIGFDFARNMTELATNIERIQAYSSGTMLSRAGGMIPHRGLAQAAVIGGATFAGAEAVLHGLLSPKLALGVGAVTVSNYALSQALTNPATVRWLAAQSARQLAVLEARHADQFSEMSTSPTVH